MNEIRMTSQRKVIIEALKMSKSHPPADAVYEYVRKKLPNVSLGTVYRNLELMYKNGMIIKIDTPDGQKRFDYNTSAHPHFRCERCGKIEDIPFDIHAPALSQESEWVKKRKIKSSTLHYQGLCEECASET
ncbi:MAG: transcriptional repressor [Spirochaetales bacterium]|nr:transcriptional repressor [Spirochaetales bacterium]